MSRTTATTLGVRSLTRPLGDTGVTVGRPVSADGGAVAVTVTATLSEALLPSSSVAVTVAV
jgi:hypothetical protein